MREDLTYRQQRNLNLISESLLTGKSEPAFQAGREAAMLGEQTGFDGSGNDDLTYRQQRNLNLISEALLTGRTELAEQALEEAMMLYEQMGGTATGRRPASGGPGSVGGPQSSGGKGGSKKGRGGVLGDIARTPRRVVTKIIRGIDKIFGDNLSNEQERKTATTILVAALLKQLEVDVPTPSGPSKPGGGGGGSGP